MIGAVGALHGDKEDRVRVDHVDKCYKFRVYSVSAQGMQKCANAEFIEGLFPVQSYYEAVSVSSFQVCNDASEAIYWVSGAVSAAKTVLEWTQYEFESFVQSSS